MNKLYNLGDSWAWGYNDNFDIPFKTTYAGIVAEHFGLTKIRCCKPGWALGNAVEQFLQRVYPKITEGDCVLVTVPPDTRLVVAGPQDSLLDTFGHRRTVTVFSDDDMWIETVARCNGNPYQFELTLNKDLLLIASLCTHKKVKYAFQHNYSEFTYDPHWDSSMILDYYIDTDNSMLNWLGIDQDHYIGNSIQNQMDNNLAGPELLVNPLTMVTESVHPNIQGHKHIANILTHKLEQLWNMQQTNGIT